MAFIVPAIIFIVKWVGVAFAEGLLMSAFRRSPHFDVPAPEQFQTPTAEEGRCFPWIWGTREVRNPNLTWYETHPPQAIVQGGATVAYKYFMSGRYVFGITDGTPVDDIVDVRWNEKPVGAGVGSANDGIVFRYAPLSPQLVAHIPHKNYGSGSEIAAAAEKAMKDLVPPGPLNIKVTFGFKILAGVNDTLVLSVDITGGGGRIYARIPAGDYVKIAADRSVLAGFTIVPGQALADAVKDALNHPYSRVGSFGGTFDCTFNGSTNHFTIRYIEGGGEHFGLLTLHVANDFISYANTANTTLGFRIGGSDYLSPLGQIESQYAVYAQRFVFGFAGSTFVLYLTDPRFTSAGLLGLATTSEPHLLVKVGDSDFVAITAIYTDHEDYLQIDIDDPTFFGTEGGVQGRIDIYKGSLSQAPSAFLTAQWGSTAPNYPCELYAVLQVLYIGNSNIPKPFAVTFQRCPNTLGLPDGTHNIRGDANPAAMLWETCVEPRVLLGMPESDIDRDSLLALGQTCFDEGLGLSLVLDTVQTAEDVVNEIARHIDAFAYEDPVTDIITFKLAREDYEVEDLPLVTIDNADEIKLTRASPEDSRNVVRLTYLSRELGYTERTVQRENQANIQSRNGDQSIQGVSFPGFSNEETALFWCMRVLRILSRPPAQIEMTNVNREHWQLRPGSPFRLTCEPLGITDRPCRAMRVAPGPLGNSGILVDAVEDVIGAPWTNFIAPTAPPDDPDEPTDLPPPPPGGAEFETFEGQVIPTL